VLDLSKYAKYKGLNLLGTGDFQHPKYLEELKSKLKPTGTGFYEYDGINYVLQTEVANIYTHNGKSRKVHHVILAPDFDAADEIQQAFLKWGRIDYDGRPIFGVNSQELVKMIMAVNPKCEVIPAHCLPPDELIQTNGSIKRIDNIKTGDKVLTHKGRFCTVKKVLKRRYTGDLVNPQPACFNEGTYLTPEHPVLAIKSYKTCKNVSHTICKPTCAYLKRGCKKKEFRNYKPSWVQAGNLEKGDIVLFPRFTAIDDKKSIRLSDLFKEFLIQGGFIKPRNVTNFKKNICINNEIVLSEDFMRLAGYYLAEGYSVRDYVAFTFNKKEREYINDVKVLLKKVFGESINVFEKEERLNSNALSVIVDSIILSKFFKKLFYSSKP